MPPYARDLAERRGASGDACGPVSETIGRGLTLHVGETLRAEYEVALH